MRYAGCRMRKGNRGGGTLNQTVGHCGPAFVLRPPVTRERLLKYADPDPQDAREFVRFIYTLRWSHTTPDTSGTSTSWK
jgi:hypothetical protein